MAAALSSDPGRSQPAPFWPDVSPHFLKVRHAVRDALRRLDAASAAGVVGTAGAAGVAGTATAANGVVVGLSGGADSLALLAGACAETFGPKGALALAPLARPVHAVVVDHQLQEGSGEVARQAAEIARSLGATAEVVAVDVAEDSAGGPEYAARLARHRALRKAAKARNAALLLAHTLDDQAETVILRLARGGGPQALSAIREELTWSDGTTILRPLLTVRREDTQACCAELGLKVWQDPHNDDPRFARVRVRHTILPLLERELGPGVAENLAKTAALAAQDNDCLDHAAASALTQMVGSQVPSESGLDVRALADLDPAVATRVLGRWLRGAGGEPSSKQLDAVMALVRNYRGQGGVQITRAAPTTRADHARGEGEAGARLVVARKDGTLKLLRDNT